MPLDVNNCSTILHFKITGQSPASIVASMRSAEKKVMKRANRIVEMCSRDHTKWCDPDFGPTEDDPYAARCLYRDGKTPDPAGMNSYPAPNTIKWSRPNYKKSAFKSNDDEDDDDNDTAEDDFDFGDYGGGNYGSGDNDEDIFCDDAELYREGHTANDVIQGKLGDCWFLGGLAIIANENSYLESIIFTQLTEQADQDDFNDPPTRRTRPQSVATSVPLFITNNWIDYGVWICRFNKNCEYYYVIIDDRIPVYNSRNGQPVFARCRDPNELWVPIIEKAYAKLHGSYDSLIGGYIDNALRDMTGLCSELFILKSGFSGFDTFNDKLVNHSDFSDMLLRRLYEGSLMGCSIQPEEGKSNAVEAQAGNGLFQRHAYSLLNIIEITLKNGQKEKLVMLRNPWGHGEWMGQWSDSSDIREEYDEVIKDALQKQVKKPSLNVLTRHVEGQKDHLGDVGVEQGNDGIFFMSWSDFLANFTHLFSVINFPPEYRGFRWAGEWTSDNAGGSENCRTFNINPKYYLEIPEDNSDIYIQLLQEDLRSIHGKTYKSNSNVISFHLIPEGLENDKSIFDRTKVIPGTDFYQPCYSFHDSVCSFGKIKKGKYTIVPCTFDRGRVGKFYLSIYSNCEGVRANDADIIAEEEELIISDVKGVSSEEKKKTPYKYEQSREQLMSVLDKRGINPSDVFRKLKNENESRYDITITLKDFKNELIKIGFQLCDLPDELIYPLSGDDNEFQISDLLDLFNYEVEKREKQRLKEKGSKEIDDLQYAPLEGDGTIHLNILEATDLQLESEKEPEAQDYIDWIYTSDDSDRLLRERRQKHMGSMFSGCRLILKKVSQYYNELKTENKLPKLAIIQELDVSQFDPYIDYQYPIDTVLDSTRVFIPKELCDLVREFSTLNYYVTVFQARMIILFTKNQNHKFIHDFLLSDYDKESKVLDRPHLNEALASTTHLEEINQEIEKPITEKDFIIDPNLPFEDKKNRYKELRNRSIGQKKQFNFSLTSNSLKYCSHCKRELDSIEPNDDGIRSKPCSTPECSNLLCINCYNTIIDKLCPICLVSNIKVKYKPGKVSMKSDLTGLVDDVQLKLHCNDHAKVWIPSIYDDLLDEVFSRISIREMRTQVDGINLQSKLINQVISNVLKSPEIKPSEDKKTPEPYLIYNRLLPIKIEDDDLIQRNKSLKSELLSKDVDNTGLISIKDFTQLLEILDFKMRQDDLKYIISYFQVDISTINYKALYNVMDPKQDQLAVDSLNELRVASENVAWKEVSNQFDLYSDMMSSCPILFQKLLQTVGLHSNIALTKRVAFIFQGSPNDFRSFMNDPNMAQLVLSNLETIETEFAKLLAKYKKEFDLSLNLDEIWQKISSICDGIIKTQNLPDKSIGSYNINIFLQGLLLFFESYISNHLPTLYRIVQENNTGNTSKSTDILTPQVDTNQDLDNQVDESKVNDIEINGTESTQPKIKPMDLTLSSLLGRQLFQLRIISDKFNVRSGNITKLIFEKLLNYNRISHICTRLQFREKNLSRKQLDLSHVFLSISYVFKDKNPEFLIVVKNPFKIQFHELKISQLQLNKKNNILRCPIAGFSKKFYINNSNFPKENLALDELASRIHFTRNRETGERSLTLRESERFVVELQKAFDSWEKGFDFFTNINASSITFRREIENDNISHMKHIILNSLRENSQLTNWLASMNRCMDVVFESTGSTKSNFREVMEWSEFVCHLKNQRNPYVTCKLVPNNEDKCYMGKPSFDGGKCPNLSTVFNIPYFCDNREKVVIYSDIRFIGTQCVIISYRIVDSKPELIAYHNDSSSQIQLLNVPNDLNLKSAIYDKEFQKRWSEIMNKLELGESLSPSIILTILNNNNEIGITTIPVSNITSLESRFEKKWFPIYNQGKQTGLLHIEYGFSSADVVKAKQDIEEEKRKREMELRRRNNEKADEIDQISEQASAITNSINGIYMPRIGPRRSGILLTSSKSRLLEIPEESEKYQDEIERYKNELSHLKVENRNYKTQESKYQSVVQQLNESQQSIQNLLEENEKLKSLLENYKLQNTYDSNQANTTNNINDNELDWTEADLNILRGDCPDGYFVSLAKDKSGKYHPAYGNRQTKTASWKHPITGQKPVHPRSMS